MKTIPTLILLSILAFTSCENNSQKKPISTNVIESDSSETIVLEVEDTVVKPTLSNHQSEIRDYQYPEIPTTDTEVQVEDMAVYVLNRLRDKKLDEILPVLGNEFIVSNKVFIDTPMTSFPRGIFAEFLTDNTDGTIYETTLTSPSGESLEITPNHYFNAYIWDKDYSQADLYINEYIVRGTMLNNIQERFPECETVEAIIEGENEYDWSALNLVFRKLDGKYYLVGLIHDQHTI